MSNTIEECMFINNREANFLNVDCLEDIDFSDNDTICKFKVYNCSNLDKITLSNNSKLRMLYLHECNNLKTLTLNKNNCLYMEIINCNSLEYVKLYERLSLCLLSLSKCNSIKDIKLYNSANLTSVIVSNCNSIKRIIIDEELDDEIFVSINPQILTSLFQSITAFFYSIVVEHCPSLTLINPEKFITLNSIDIMRCNSLTELLLTENINLKNLSLDECNGLISLNLKNNIKLEKIKLNNCDLLEDLAILENIRLKMLGLIGCSSLKTLDLRKSKNILVIVITNCSSLETIILPQNSKLIHFKVSHCKSFKYIKTIENSDVSCNNKSHIVELLECDSLELLHFNFIKDIKIIKLTKCSSLKEISLIEYKTLSELSIYNCNSLKDVFFNQNICYNSIDIGQCDSIKEIISISVYKFHIVNCDSITNISVNFIEGSLLNISDCKNLQDISFNPGKDKKYGNRLIIESDLDYLRKLYVTHLDEFTIDSRKLSRLEKVYIEYVNCLNAYISTLSTFIIFKSDEISIDISLLDSYLYISKVNNIFFYNKSEDDCVYHKDITILGYYNSNTSFPIIELPSKVENKTTLWINTKIEYHTSLQKFINDNNVELISLDCINNLDLQSKDIISINDMKFYE